ncbi:MAG: hypothetical protein NVV74_13950 [Magnetospirillum sp.]|nr:hypothetical protein [Magnetospirillum sp.]
MFQGALGKGRIVPFGPYAEAESIPTFAVEPTRLEGIIRPRVTAVALVRLIGGLAITALGLMPFLDAEFPFDPVAMALCCGLGGLMAAAQLFLWTRRCRIAIAEGRVRVRQSHAVFAPLEMDVPWASFSGVILAQFGEGRRAIRAVLLTHSDWAKVVPLAWARSYRDMAAAVGRYAAALRMPALEAGEDLVAYPAAAFDLPLADKVARRLVVAAAPGVPPATLAVEFQGGRTVIAFTPRRRLRLEGRRVAFETRFFGRWSSRWSVDLASVQGVQVGQWVGFRKTLPAVTLRTADALRFAGPCPDAASARWLRTRLVADAAG